MKQCYNCRKVLEKENKTKEHIPAKNLFRGFNQKLSNNIITVPACKKCNEEFGKNTDEEFRNFIAAISGEGKNTRLMSPTIKSIKINWKKYKNRLINRDGQKIYVVNNLIGK